MAEILRLNLQDDAANTTVIAAVGDNATLAGGDNTADIAEAGPGGLFPSSLNFDGDNDKITLGETVTLTGELTFSFWLKNDSNLSSDSICGGNGGASRLILPRGSVSAATLRIDVEGNQNQDTLSEDVENDTWTHWLIIRNSSNVWSLYRDGVLDAAIGFTQAGEFIFNEVAANATGGALGFLEGGLAGFAVRNDAADSAERQSLFDEGKPQNTVAPVISGTPTVGETLTVTSDGTWSDGSTSARQWQHDGTNIAGETGTTYVVEADYIGENITCVISRTNSVGTLTESSNELGPVEAAAGGAVFLRRTLMHAGA